MTVSFRIIKAFNVVYVKYRGATDMREALALFEAYMSHPDCRPGQKQFVDMSEIEEPFGDYTQTMKFMAKMADQFTDKGPQTLLVCLAPTPVARKAALIGQNSWNTVDHVVFRVIEDEAEALAFLGLPYKSIADLLITA